MTALNDKRSMPFGGSFAIIDPNISLPSDNVAEFCSRYLDWIKSTNNNKLIGLESFTHFVFSNGTTEAFDKFYYKHRTRRLRVFKGDYAYHSVALRSDAWEWLDGSCLDPNDAVIISLPFADTGNEHHLYQSILNECDRLAVPVLIDCAYFGVCSNIIFDFNHPCITDIAFSLSKTFPVAYNRIGMRLSRTDSDDALFMINKMSYTNRNSVDVGIENLKKFGPDHLVETYKSKQLDFCRHLGLEPSNTVLFGIDVHNKYPEYNRGGQYNRLSFHKYLSQDSNIFYNENSPR
jgi:hypothetical protein